LRIEKNPGASIAKQTKKWLAVIRKTALAKATDPWTVNSFQPHAKGRPRRKATELDVDVIAKYNFEGQKLSAHWPACSNNNNKHLTATREAWSEAWTHYGVPSFGFDAAGYFREAARLRTAVITACNNAVAELIALTDKAVAGALDLKNEVYTLRANPENNIPAKSVTISFDGRCTVHTKWTPAKFK
jgi:hypothetical protein